MSVCMWDIDCAAIYLWDVPHLHFQGRENKNRWHLPWEGSILSHRGKCYFLPPCGTQTSCFYFACFFQ